MAAYLRRKAEAARREAEAEAQRLAAEAHNAMLEADAINSPEADDDAVPRWHEAQQAEALRHRVNARTDAHALTARRAGGVEGQLDVHA